MLYINGSNRQPVEMIRGNSEIFQIGITVNGSEYTPQAGDKITFTLRRDVMDLNRKEYIGDVMFKRDIPIDTMQLVLAPEDTENLPLVDFVYDLKITFADGKVKTFVKPSPFILKGD